jgi:hypothetical protein
MLSFNSNNFNILKVNSAIILKKMPKHCTEKEKIRIIILWKGGSSVAQIAKELKKVGLQLIFG